MRKQLATLSAFALIASSAVMPVLAENNTTVLNSGDKATVVSTSTTNTNVNTVVSNTAIIDQTSNINQNSGNNILSGNISLNNACNPCALGGGVGLQTGSNTATVNQTASGINSNVVGVSIDANSQAHNNTDLVNTGDSATVVTSDTVNTNVNTAATNNAFVGQHNSVNQNSGFNVLNDNIGSPIVAVTGNNGATVNQNVSDLNSNVVGVAIHAPTSTANVGCMLCGAPCLQGNCTSVTNTGDKALVVSTAVTNTNLNTYAANSLWSWQSSWTNQNSGFNFLGDNIGGGALATGSNGAGTTQGLSGNANAIGVSVGSTMPLGSGNMANIINTGLSLTSITTATDNTNANTAATNLLFGWQSEFTSSNSGFNLEVNNIGGGMAITGGNLGGTTQGLHGNSNTALVGSNPLSMLALLAMLL